jgi:hypothetical protein
VEVELMANIASKELFLKFSKSNISMKAIFLVVLCLHCSLTTLGGS